MIVACEFKSPYDKQFQLGYRFIDEENYKEDIVSFNKAIEIDAKRAKEVPVIYASSSYGVSIYEMKDKAYLYYGEYDQEMPDG